MAALLASTSDQQASHTSSPTTSSPGSGSDGSDFVILSKPTESNALGSPGDIMLQSNLVASFAAAANNVGDISTTMLNAEHLMAAFTGLKQENSMLKGTYL